MIREIFNEVKEDIQVVFERDPAARGILETVLTCPGFQAVLLHRFSSRLWQRHWHLIARVSAHIARFLTGIEIHPGARIGRRFFIDHGMGVVIGETAEIGDDVSIYHGVTLGGTTWEKSKRHPTLGNHVVIGAGAKILGPIMIGERTRIGCNAVVVKNVPADSTVVGVPGREIGKHKEQGADNERETIAKKIGFEAYAERKNMPDPIQNTLDSVLDHLHKTDQQMEQLKQAIESKSGEKTD